MDIYILSDLTDISPELQYISNLFGRLLNARFLLVNPSDFSASKDNICIEYCQFSRSEHFRSDCKVRIFPDVLFWKKYLEKQPSEFYPRETNEICVFGTSGTESFLHIEDKCIDTNLDIFASAFLQVTRLEEVINSTSLDQHGRYQFKNSMIGERYIDVPHVNMYALKLAEWIEKTYQTKVSLKSEFAVVISHDIDIPFYFSRGRSELSELKNSFLKKNGKYKNWLDLWHYAKFIIGAESDPYDTFEYMCNVEKEYGVKSTYFILLCEDNRWGLDLKRYSQRLNMLIEAGHEIALHPGYAALADESVIAEQRDALEQLVGQKIHGVRHHFLRFQIPESYRAISSCGLDYDSSLGFAEKHGFRTGICTPFQPYDTKYRTSMDLWEIPLIVMDGTLKDFEGFSPEEALEKIKNIAITIRDAGGVLVLNWHNSFFEQGGVAWYIVYEESLRFFSELNARFCTCNNLIKSVAEKSR